MAREAVITVYNKGAKAAVRDRNRAVRHCGPANVKSYEKT